MTVTVKLGLRYVWVDSLCILDDDPEDRSREIANMADTYQGAFVTISAASSASVVALPKLLKLLCSANFNSIKASCLTGDRYHAHELACHTNR